MLGDAYEYLIKKFADLTNRKAGEFYTPRAVVELMVRMLAPKAGDTVYDPACGTGGMLLETIQQVTRSRRRRTAHARPPLRPGDATSPPPPSPE